MCDVPSNEFTTSRVYVLSGLVVVACPETSHVEGLNERPTGRAGVIVHVVVLPTGVNKPEYQF
jgi:hypothetical protein